MCQHHLPSWRISFAIDLPANNSVSFGVFGTSPIPATGIRIDGKPFEEPLAYTSCSTFSHNAPLH
jgi:hypothetical protein